MSDALFVDTNVFMYLAGGDADQREACRRALLAADARGDRLVTSAEVLQEILHRYGGATRAEQVRNVYSAAVAICDEILPITERETARALELLEAHPGLPARDALHVASMESRGIARMLSADRRFDQVKAVQRVDPRA